LKIPEEVPVFVCVRCSPFTVAASLATRERGASTAAKSKCTGTEVPARAVGKWQAGQVLEMSRIVSLLAHANAIANETVGHAWSYDVSSLI
jgi:hypothetical protein